MGFSCISRAGRQRASMAELMGDDVIHVAVKKNVEESRLAMLWALRNLRAEKVCILHVHQPTDTLPYVSLANELEELEAIMYETLHDYFDICQQEGLNEDEIYVSCIETGDVGKGILELIHESNVKKLVMGAAADQHYSESMVDLKSRKAKYVYQHAPSSCEIQFICKGVLIHKMEGNFYTVDVADKAPLSRGTNSIQDEQLNPKGYLESDHSAPSSGQSEIVVAIVANGEARRDIHELESNAVPLSGNHCEETNNNQLCLQLEQALVEVEKTKREAFEESVRRFEAEKDAIEAIRRAREYENMYKEESGIKKETENALTKQREVLNKTKQQRDEALLIILNGQKLYNKELRRRVEAEVALAKEKEELEKIKMEMEEVRLVIQDGLRLYDERIRHGKEIEESLKNEREKLERTKKEKEEACLISKNLMQLYEDELRQRKEIEETLKKQREEIEKTKKEKEEACLVGRDFVQLYEEELRGRKETEEELKKEREELEKAKREKDASRSVCMEILQLLQNYARERVDPVKTLESFSHHPPSYFICPIAQEIMRDPQVAADGFTYEAEALTEWLNSGHDTSPMTNLKLSHPNLVPNHALRSAIQEWLQRHSAAFP